MIHLKSSNRLCYLGILILILSQKHKMYCVLYSYFQMTVT